MNFATGELFVGSFVNDSAEGTGVYTDSRGNQYAPVEGGIFKKGKLFG